MHSNRRQHVRSGQLIRIGAYHIIWARQIVGRVGRAGSSRAQVIFKTEILNEHLICSLCMGYFRDAQSVTECLHTCTRPSYDCSIALARLPRGALLFSFGSLQSVHLQVPACQQRQGRSMSHMRRCFGTGSFRKSPVRCPGPLRSLDSPALPGSSADTSLPKMRVSLRPRTVSWASDCGTADCH